MRVLRSSKLHKSLSDRFWEGSYTKKLFRKRSSHSSCPRRLAAKYLVNKCVWVGGGVMPKVMCLQSDVWEDRCFFVAACSCFFVCCCRPGGLGSGGHASLGLPPPPPGAPSSSSSSSSCAVGELEIAIDLFRPSDFNENPLNFQHFHLLGLIGSLQEPPGANNPQQPPHNNKKHIKLVS